MLSRELGDTLANRIEEPVLGRRECRFELPARRLGNLLEIPARDSETRVHTLWGSGMAGESLPLSLSPRFLLPYPL